MKLPNDTTNSTRPDSGGDAAEALPRLGYEKPQMSRLNLASVIAGPGGSQLDSNFIGNKTTGT